MRNIDVQRITDEVKRLCMEANYNIPQDVMDVLRRAQAKEESPAGKEVLRQIIENAQIAQKERVPICQDTGFAVFFIELGQDVHIEGGYIEDAINEGVREGYREGYLRKSIDRDPVLHRVNTGDNTPAVIHLRVVPGEKLRIVFAPKGGGSENMSTVKMMKPADGTEGIKDFVVDWVKKAGGNPCPPGIVGVGIGGTFEKCALLAKEAAILPIGLKNPDPEYAKVEEELLERINGTGIGPMGLGGRVTALAVHIKTHPCHIASLPLAINIQCHAARHKEVVI